MVILVPFRYQVKEGLGYPVTRTLKTTSSPSTTSESEGNSLMEGAGVRECMRGREGGERGRDKESDGRERERERGIGSSVV